MAKDEDNYVMTIHCNVKTAKRFCNLKINGGFSTDDAFINEVLDLEELKQKEDKDCETTRCNLGHIHHGRSQSTLLLDSIQSPIRMDLPSYNGDAQPDSSIRSRNQSGIQFLPINLPAGASTSIQPEVDAPLVTEIQSPLVQRVGNGVAPFSPGTVTKRATPKMAARKGARGRGSGGGRPRGRGRGRPSVGRRGGSSGQKGRLMTVVNGRSDSPELTTNGHMTDFTLDDSFNADDPSTPGPSKSPASSPAAKRTKKQKKQPKSHEIVPDSDGADSDHERSVDQPAHAQSMRRTVDVDSSPSFAEASTSSGSARVRGTNRAIRGKGRKSGLSRISNLPTDYPEVKREVESPTPSAPSSPASSLSPEPALSDHFQPKVRLEDIRYLVEWEIA